jgi:hypothetical protein
MFATIIPLREVGPGLERRRIDDDQDLPGPRAEDFDPGIDEPGEICRIRHRRDRGTTTIGAGQGIISRIHAGALSLLPGASVLPRCQILY